MKPKNSLSTFILVLVFSVACKGSSTLGDVPTEFSSAENSGSVRLLMEDVSQLSRVFLSDKKTSPAIDVGNGMITRLEIEEPSDDNKVMNAARKMIGETPAVMEAAKRKLVILLKNDSMLNVPWQNDAWLIRFLRLRHYDVHKTHKLIRSYYKFKAKNSAIYENLIPSKEKEVAECEVMGVLPNRDPAGSRIMIVSTKQWDPKKYSLVRLLRLGMVFAETGAYEPATQLAGIQVIFDSDGMTWQHKKHITPMIAKSIVHWLLKSAPVRVAGIHVINQSHVFWSVFNIFKPFLTQELRNKIHFHGASLKSLYRYVPAASLPDTLGGSFPKPSFSSYEWDVLLQSQDEEFAKIGSYGLKRRT